MANWRILLMMMRISWLRGMEPREGVHERNAQRRRGDRHCALVVQCFCKSQMLDSLRTREIRQLTEVFVNSQLQAVRLDVQRVGEARDERHLDNMRVPE